MTSFQSSGINPVARTSSGQDEQFSSTNSASKGTKEKPRLRAKQESSDSDTKRVLPYTGGDGRGDTRQRDQRFDLIELSSKGRFQFVILLKGNDGPLTEEDLLLAYTDYHLSLDEVGRNKLVRLTGSVSLYGEDDRYLAFRGDVEGTPEAIERGLKHALDSFKSSLGDRLSDVRVEYTEWKEGLDISFWGVEATKFAVQVLGNSPEIRGSLGLFLAMHGIRNCELHRRRIVVTRTVPVSFNGRTIRCPETRAEENTLAVFTIGDRYKVKELQDNLFRLLRDVENYDESSGFTRRLAIFYEGAQRHLVKCHTRTQEQFERAYAGSERQLPAVKKGRERALLLELARESDDRNVRKALDEFLHAEERFYTLSSFRGLRRNEDDALEDKRRMNDARRALREALCSVLEKGGLRTRREVENPHVSQLSAWKNLPPERCFEERRNYWREPFWVNTRQLQDALDELLDDPAFSTLNLRWAKVCEVKLPIGTFSEVLGETSLPPSEVSEIAAAFRARLDEVLISRFGYNRFGWTKANRRTDQHGSWVLDYRPNAGDKWKGLTYRAASLNWSKEYGPTFVIRSNTPILRRKLASAVAPFRFSVSGPDVGTEFVLEIERVKVDETALDALNEEIEELERQAILLYETRDRRMDAGVLSALDSQKISSRLSKLSARQSEKQAELDRLLRAQREAVSTADEAGLRKNLLKLLTLVEGSRLDPKHPKSPLHRRISFGAYGSWYVAESYSL